MTDTCLVLRLAAPLQSWGSSGRLNRRDTDRQPTKAGLVGLLAAAQGRRRTDPIEDLTRLQLAVRTDQPGRLVHDYHTVSRHTGENMPKAEVDTRGQQRRSTTGGTKVTSRYYLADATFVAAIGSDDQQMLHRLAQALQRPTFALALGRRGCPPTTPLLLPAPDHSLLWDGRPVDVLADVPWQAGHAARRQAAREKTPRRYLEVHYDSDDGAAVDDVPVTFDPKRRRRAARRVAHTTVAVDTGVEAPPGADTSGLWGHDPYLLT